MNVINTLTRVLKSAKRAEEDEEERVVIRLKEADGTNTGLERSIIECADGSSVAEITRGIATSDLVWATWVQKRMREAIPNLEQRGFIRVENRQKSLRLCD